MNCMRIEGREAEELYLSSTPHIYKEHLRILSDMCKLISETEGIYYTAALRSEDAHLYSTGRVSFNYRVYWTHQEGGYSCAHEIGIRLREFFIENDVNYITTGGRYPDSWTNARLEEAEGVSISSVGIGISYCSFHESDEHAQLSFSRLWERVNKTKYPVMGVR